MILNGKFNLGNKNLLCKSNGKINLGNENLFYKSNGKINLSLPLMKSNENPIRFQFNS